MTTYFDLVVKNKDHIKVEVIKIINNKTMFITWSFSCNLHCDYGIRAELMTCLYTERKSKVNKHIQLYQKATGRKFKLTKTNNDANYTRLIYSI